MIGSKKQKYKYKHVWKAMLTCLAFFLYYFNKKNHLSYFFKKLKYITYILAIKDGWQVRVCIFRK